MIKCRICKDREQTENHHWAYDWSECDVTTVPVCHQCHMMAHSVDLSRPSETEGDLWVFYNMASVARYLRQNDEERSVGELIDDLNIPEKYEELFRYVYNIDVPLFIDGIQIEKYESNDSMKRELMTNGREREVTYVDRNRPGSFETWDGVELDDLDPHNRTRLDFDDENEVSFLMI